MQLTLHVTRICLYDFTYTKFKRGVLSFRLAGKHSIILGLNGKTRRRKHFLKPELYAYIKNHLKSWI